MASAFKLIIASLTCLEVTVLLSCACTVEEVNNLKYICAWEHCSTIWRDCMAPFIAIISAWKIVMDKGSLPLFLIFVLFFFFFFFSLSSS